MRNDGCDGGSDSCVREVTIGRTLYRVTSRFDGQRELGATLEALAVEQALDDMNRRSKALLRGERND